jgi:hypothetical protein
MGQRSVTFERQALHLRRQLGDQLVGGRQLAFHLDRQFTQPDNQSNGIHRAPPSATASITT